MFLFYRIKDTNMLEQMGETIVLDSEDDVENFRKKLIYRSWHRGTREMDLIMGSFVDRYIQSFDQVQLMEYYDVLCENDPDLYDWISGREDLPQDKESSVMAMLLVHQVPE